MNKLQRLFRTHLAMTASGFFTASQSHPLTDVVSTDLSPQDLARLATEARDWANTYFAQTHDAHLAVKREWVKAGDELRKLESARQPNKAKIAEAQALKDSLHADFKATLHTFIIARSVEEYGRYLPAMWSAVEWNDEALYAAFQIKAIQTDLWIGSYLDA